MTDNVSRMIRLSAELQVLIYEVTFLTTCIALEGLESPAAKKLGLANYNMEKKLSEIVKLDKIIQGK